MKEEAKSMKDFGIHSKKSHQQSIKESGNGLIHSHIGRTEDCFYLLPVELYNVSILSDLNLVIEVGKRKVKTNLVCCVDLENYPRTLK